jgi:hypothetical protein
VPTYAIAFPDSLSAARARDELVANGYSVELQPQPSQADVVLAARPTEQIRSKHDEILALMETIANRHQGDLMGSGGLSGFGLGGAYRDE